MARVSKKVSAAQREAENAPHRIWKTAIYARLSDFDDVLRDTESGFLKESSMFFRFCTQTRSGLR